MGTDGQGIDIFDPLEETIEPFEFNNQLSDKAILCLAEVPGESILIGTYTGGLVRFDIEKKRLDYIDEVTARDIRCLTVTHGRTVFVGTNGGGVYKYNDGNSVSIESTNSLDVRDIKQGDNDIIWLGTYGNGLVKLNLKTESLSYFNWKEKLA